MRCQGLTYDSVGAYNPRLARGGYGFLGRAKKMISSRGITDIPHPSTLQPVPFYHMIHRRKIMYIHLQRNSPWPNSRGAHKRILCHHRPPYVPDVVAVSPPQHGAAEPTSLLLRQHTRRVHLCMHRVVCILSFLMSTRILFVS